jgi:hypothetical protein
MLSHSGVSIPPTVCTSPLHHRFVFVRAQDQAHGWVLAFAHFFGLEVTGVQQHLPDVLLRSRAGFQVDQHEAVQRGAKGAGSF